uniref:Fungal lipase-type domain-containing protein n=1 Tax=viral metagenome TaxID=1070528 RepID=A0A6C0JYL3_9ZZZZ
MKLLFHTIFALFYGALFAYNRDISNTAVWLSGAAYCGKDSYKSMKLSGPATSFIVDSILYDPKTDLQGYTGILKSTRTIYVVFRGSSSKLNWVADFEVTKRNYDTYPECECKVHRGFYDATKNLKDQVINSMKILKEQTGFSNVIVTGHSLGAAIAQLMGMELSAVNIKNKIYNFGQPRIGDKKYARFVNSISEELVRFTHYKDIVPHVPPMEMGYLHSCREIFEDDTGKTTECSLSECEDSKCADQYKLSKTNMEDHMIYLGHYLDCSNSTYSL